MTSASRQKLTERIGSIVSILNESYIQERALNDVEHNLRALTLRNGLAVVLFATLERFLRGRIGEITDWLCRSGVQFSDLPEGLREAATHGALRGISFQAEMRLRQGEDPTSFIQAEALRISSTVQSIFHISGSAFISEKPNLSADDVKKVLSAFRVKDGWGTLQNFAVRAGVSSPSLLDGFRNAALRRHKAAHKGDEQVTVSDLDSFSREALGIAMAFDAIASRAARLIVIKDPSIAPKGAGVDQSKITIRYLRKGDDGWYREIVEGKSRAINRTRDLNEAIQKATIGATVNQEFIVVQGRNQVAEDWFVTDGP